MQRDDLEQELKKQVFGLPRAIYAGQGTIDHPLLQALQKKVLTSEQLQQFCDVRYNAVSKFELLLEHARNLAQVEGKHALAAALDENLGDERGTSKRSAGKGSHAAWREDFLNALEVPLRSDADKTYPLYAFGQSDDLPTLVGVLLAAEYSIPAEDAHLLGNLRRVFPDTFTNPQDPQTPSEAQAKATLYLADHISHDRKSHLPELMEAIEHDFPSPEDKAKIKAGIVRFAAERKGQFYYIQQVIGYEAPEEATGAGRAA